MKKRLLFLSMALLFVTGNIIAQTINVSAGWPNTNWSLDGTYAASAVLSDPTTTADFGYDDDAAGSGSTDSIAAVSPIIDVTPAQTNNENYLQVSFDYNYNQLSSDSLTLQYWDADASQWMDWGNAPENYSLSSGYCGSMTGNNFVSTFLDISGYTSTQLSGFKYRVLFSGTGTWAYGFCMESPTLTSNSCIPPTALTATNLMPNSADLGWTENGGAGEWQIEYDTTGFTQGTGTIVSNISSNPYTLNMLSDNYTYDYYVRSVCSPGDTSAWAGPYTFTTPCNATNVPYIQDFESANTPNMPSCTSIENAGAGNDWKTASISNSGFNSNVLNYSYDFSNPANAWFYTQGINLTAGTNYIITFNYGNYGTYQEKLITAVGTSPSYSDMADTLGDITTPDNTDKTLQTYYFTAPTSDVYYFGFNAHSAANLNQLYVDSIVVDAGPSCVPNTNLTATNLTINSADLGWTENGGAGEWQIEYDTTGFTQGTGTIVSNISSNPYTLNTLTDSYTYDYYVRSVCSPGDTSAWAGPYTFTTPQIPVSTFPYTEDWESGVDSWALQNGGQTNQWVVGSAIANGGTQSLYVSDDGGTTNHYTTSASSAVHAYRDFTFPAVAPQINVSFDWQAMGETTSWDKLRVYIAPTSFNPTPGTKITASGTAPTGIVQLGSVNYNGSSSFATESFSLPPGYANTNSRLIFEWSNDGGSGAQPPAAVDNIQVSIHSCADPIGLSTNAVSSTSADLAWVDTTGATEWQVQYDTTGFALGNGTMVNNVLDTFTTVPMANHSTIDFYVRTVCSPGDTSAWAGPFTLSNFYCTPSATDNTMFIDDFITSQALQNVSNTGSGFSNGGYGDFTTDTIIAIPGSTINFTTNMGSGTSTFGFRIWIDKGNDLSFDTGDVVYQSSAYSSTQTGSFTVPSTDGIYRMRIGNDWLGSAGPTDPCITGFTDGEFEDYTIKVYTPSCLPPIDLTINNLTPTSVDFAWADTTGATQWQVEYDTTGFVQGTGTMISNVLDTFTSVSSLNPNTQYDFYVRTVCGAGDTSVWAGPYSFPTPCTSYDANGFWETVEENSQTLGCWRVRDANADGDTWAIYAGEGNNGSDRAFGIHTDFNSGANDDYLISPAINLTGAESLKFSYKVQSSTEPNDFEVLLSTTGTLPSDFTDTLMYDANYSNTDYKDTVVDLTSYTGTVYIAFHVPQGGLDGYYLYIDDVRFGQCIPTPGTDGATDACQTEGNVDLPSIIQTNNNYGTWEFPANSSVIQNGNEFNVSTLAGGAYDVMYVVQGLCAGEADTTIATVNVYPPSSAGINGTVTVCKNEPINLFGGLQGNVDMGGTWYDPSNQPITGSQPNAGTIPGNFNYFYVVSNTACPADTALVNVIVDGTCDATGLANEAFNQLSVFPNPTSNKINIVNPTNEENLKIVVLDMNGRVVLRDNKSLSNNEKATLSLSRLDKGIYTLKVSNTKGQKVFKIVKQ